MEQRNAALERAEADGFDVMIVQDADEFYTAAAYAANLRFLAENRDCDYFRAKWYVFWKTTDYVVEAYREGLLTNCENFAVNLGRGFRSRDKRRATAKTWRYVPGVCCHLSYVYSDTEVKEKIGTWGHAHQTSVSRWFERKWVHWTPSTRNLCPINFPATYRRAVPFAGERPESFALVEVPALTLRPAPSLRRWAWVLNDIADFWHLWFYRTAVDCLLAVRHLRGIRHFPEESKQSTDSAAAIVKGNS